MHLIWDGLVQVGTSGKSGLISPTSREGQSPLTTWPDIPRPPSLLQLQHHPLPSSCRVALNLIVFKRKELPVWLYQGAARLYIYGGHPPLSCPLHLLVLKIWPLPPLGQGSITDQLLCAAPDKGDWRLSHLENGRSSSSRSM